MKISLFSRKRSDESSFEELVMPHTEGLYRLAYHYTGNTSDAEDLVQELLIKLYKRTDEMASIDNLRPWLAKSLYHLYIDRVRYSQRQPIDMAEEIDSIHHSEPLSPPLDEPSQYDLQRDLAHALAQLGDEQRQVILLHDVESYTLEELSTIYDIPLGTLKSRLHRARAQLRKLLE